MGQSAPVREGVELLRQLKDELGLQAWLAAAELRHPSLRHEETRREVDALLLMRDELRLQAHLGRMNAADEFAHLESRWKKLQEAVGQVADDAEEGLTDLLRQIREGYQKMTRR